MELLKILLDRLKSGSPKLFAWIRNIAILLLAVMTALPETGIDVSFIPDNIYNGLMWALPFIAGTAQLTKK